MENCTHGPGSIAVDAGDNYKCVICQAATIKQLRARREAQDRLHIENTNDLVACRERIAALEGAVKKLKDLLVYGDHPVGDSLLIKSCDIIDQALAEGGGPKTTDHHRV